MKRPNKSGRQRWLGLMMAGCLILTPPVGAAGAPHAGSALPAPGDRVGLSLPHRPPLLNGLQLDPQNPLQLQFYLSAGDAALSANRLREEGRRMVGYFLTALTIPQADLWVNLSPFEKGRIIPPELGGTQMGQTLLEQDYLLKQLSASLLHPQTSSGQTFWSRMYQRAFETYGTIEVPVNTFHKVWIVPEPPTIVTDGKTAVVADAPLRVFLEGDLLARGQRQIQHQEGRTPFPVSSFAAVKAAADTDELSTAVMREEILPLLEAEVNEGRHFAPLRQIVNALALALWYKQHVQDTVVSRWYVDQHKTAGLPPAPPAIAGQVFERYRQAYAKGVVNDIRDVREPATGRRIPRRYFSGGFTAGASTAIIVDNNGSFNPGYQLSVQLQPRQAYDGDEQRGRLAFFGEEIRMMATNLNTEPRAVTAALAAALPVLRYPYTNKEDAVFKRAVFDESLINAGVTTSSDAMEALTIESSPHFAGKIAMLRQIEEFNLNPESSGYHIRFAVDGEGEDEKAVLVFENRRDKDLSFSLRPHGGRVEQITFKGKKVLENWGDGGIFPMAPAPNRLKDGKMPTSDGETVALRKMSGSDEWQWLGEHLLHGFVRHLPWQVADIGVAQRESEEADRPYVTLTFNTQDFQAIHQKLGGFVIRQTFWLPRAEESEDARVFDFDVEIENRDTREQFVAFGWHPSIAGKDEEITFKIVGGEGVRHMAMDEAKLPTGAQDRKYSDIFRGSTTRLADVPKLDDTFTVPQDISVAVTNHTTGITATITSDATKWTFWNGNGVGLSATGVEPQTVGTNLQDAEPLPSGETRRYSMQMAISAQASATAAPTLDDKGSSTSTNEHGGIWLAPAGQARVRHVDTFARPASTSAATGMDRGMRFEHFQGFAFEISDPQVASSP